MCVCVCVCACVCAGTSNLFDCNMFNHAKVINVMYLLYRERILECPDKSCEVLYGNNFSGVSRGKSSEEKVLLSFNL